MALDLSQGDRSRRKIFISIAILYSLMVGMKRAINIAHSFDQIIFGWSLGAWSALYFYNCFATPLTTHLSSLTLPISKLSKNLYICLSTFAVTMIFLIATRFYSLSFPFAEEWSKNIKANC
jgi:hypothetical protein